jgi:3-hydroxy acid dehydrogenase/malonic semialdehyde reductase
VTEEGTHDISRDRRERRLRAAITRRAVREGATVIAAGRRMERLVALRDELGDAVLPLELDVTDRAMVERVLARLPAGWAAIDVLVNNAGLALGLEPAHKASSTSGKRWSTPTCAA